MSERKYLAFDIETVKEFPSGADWREHRPLGIGCAAACSVDMPEPLRWYDSVPGGDGIASRMSRDSLASLVRTLADLAGEGYTLLTWNGTGFDFDILAEESGLREECGELALSHVDMMFHLFCIRGTRWPSARPRRVWDSPARPRGWTVPPPCGCGRPWGERAGGDLLRPGRAGHLGAGSSLRGCRTARLDQPQGQPGALGAGEGLAHGAGVPLHP